ncbi:hypothetical protein QFC24_006391 [Naganishia onofrii]|uniref:Uncharacterized protein n=1 Tax=Naganishia onofrii TaxID=1851511 RepID=A0ACC2X4K2_9TREE|nr:hypothetical protein QFC24_006391 [Naganishia onofrii]
MSSSPATPTDIQLAGNKPACKHSDDERAETVSEQRPNTKNVSCHTPEVSRSGGKSPTIPISEQTVELQADDKHLRASIGKSDPILPLELHYLIAQYVASDNKFASLANYSSVCRVVRQELKSILFETVVRGEKGSNKFPEDVRMVSLFKGTKYLIVPESCRWEDRDFPNLVVAITICHPTSSANEQERQSSRTGIRILKPVHIATLSDLLRIPLIRSLVDGDGGVPRYRLVEGINAITVDALGKVFGDQTVHNSSDTSKTTPSVRSGEIDTTFTLKHAHPSLELRYTTTQLLGLVTSLATSHSDDDQSGADESGRKTPRLHFRVKEGGGPVAGLVNEIVSTPSAVSER